MTAPVEIIEAVTREIPNQKLVAMSLTAVLVRYQNEHFARIGFGSQMWVACQGQTLSFDEALIYFPKVSREGYCG